jgi:gluconokinase
MVVVVMGVSGSGKTTVGQALAARLGWPFEDADDLHPAANVEKMRRGIALTDEDREPWVRAVSRAIHDHVARGQDAVLACSALRKRHRDVMRAHVDAERLRFVYLRGTYEEIDRRLRARVGHFMPESLLKSQLDAMEEPAPGEALVVDIAPPVPAIVEAIVRGLPVRAPASCR